MYYCFSGNASQVLQIHTIKAVGQNVILLTVLTVVITIIGHLDGSGPSTFLIAIVPLLPIYKKMKVTP